MLSFPVIIIMSKTNLKKKPKSDYIYKDILRYFKIL